MNYFGYGYGFPVHGRVARVQGTFEVIDSRGIPEVKKVFNNLLPITEVTTVSPQTIAGSVMNYQMSFGGVTLAKRIFLRVNFPVTVKFNQDTDLGCSVGVGDNILMSDNGITAIYITTGPNPTNVEAVIVG
jgi:hypothetical protein